MMIETTTATAHVGVWSSSFGWAWPIPASPPPPPPMNYTQDNSKKKRGKNKEENNNKKKNPKKNSRFWTNIRWNFLSIILWNGTWRDNSGDWEPLERKKRQVKERQRGHVVFFFFFFICFPQKEVWDTAVLAVKF